MKDHTLLVAKHLTVENLGLLKRSLNSCIDEGMIDTDDQLYNEILDLIAEADATDSWEGLSEVIALAETLETDVCTWLALRGRTTLSLEWPTKPD